MMVDANHKIPVPVPCQLIEKYRRAEIEPKQLQEDEVILAVKRGERE